MDIIADQNVPEEYVSALRGDGHSVPYSRDIGQLGEEAIDTDILVYAESVDAAILSTDEKDFGGMDAEIPIFVAPQNLTGGQVRRAIAEIEALPADPSQMEPIWLTGLL